MQVIEDFKSLIKKNSPESTLERTYEITRPKIMKAAELEGKPAMVELLQHSADTAEGNWYLEIILGIDIQND